MKYLVKMTPLEAYSFGTDQGFEYPGEDKTGKESYFVRSRELPEQTTILGLFRYLILQHQGLLKTDFTYTNDERSKMQACIGTESFSFAKDSIQDYGYIQSISPVFLVNEDNQIYVRNPFHNKANKNYMPMQMQEGFETSAGVISLPKKGEFDVKKWYASGYYNIATGDIIENKDLFVKKIVSGNRKNDKNGTDEEGFFKRELIILNNKFSFAVFVDAKELPQKTVGYMGKKKSAFLVEANEVENINLTKMVEDAFAHESEVWYYALSDLVVNNQLKYDEFCIVEEKPLRNLETVYQEGNHLRKLKKSKIRYHLIQSGSVFYKKCSLNTENDNCKKIGYNHLVRLGGN